jgi:tetratricopeptide (TPR) repeat protein
MRNIVLLAFLFFGIYANAQDINAAIEEFNQGNQALQSEDFPLAIQKYKTALEIATTLGEEGQELMAAAKKQIPTLYYQIGIQDYKEKNNEKAIIELQNAIKYGEEYGEQDMVDKSKDLIPKIHFARGNDLFKDGKFDEALGAYSEAIELDPLYSKPYWGQALTYQKQGKSDEMVAAFKTSRERSIAENDEIPVVRGRDKQERPYEKGVDSYETREILTQKGIEEEALSSVNTVKREEFSEKSLEPDNFNAGRHSDQKSGNLTSEVRSKKVEKIILFYNDKSFGEYYPESD